ncbi:hypothetical protein ACFL1N_02800 [Thermodesulfobacteriota bacterium]
MKSAYSINMNRLLLLIRNSILINRNLIITIAAVILTLLILDALKNRILGTSTDLYFLVLYIAGFVLTMKISRELHDTRKANTWLLLPATNLEKYIALLLLPTLLLACGLIIYITVASYLIEFCISLFITSGSSHFNPLSREILKGTANYFVILSPYFLGAVYFRKNPISYTFLCLFSYFAIFLTFTLFTGNYFLNDYIGEHMKLVLPGFISTGGTVEFGEVDTVYAMAVFEIFKSFGETWGPFIKAFFGYAAPVLFLVSGFFSFKELEQ